MIWCFLPLAGILLLIAVAFIWRPWLQLRRNGSRWILVFQPGNRAQFVRECCGVQLVTGGLYRFCRNPIFLALIVIVAGYALLLPTRLSLILLVGTCIGVRQQASAEEAYLMRTYGDSYRAYARRVGRFLPGLGKLR